MELLKRAVQSVLETERIGSPVFLRCVFHAATDPQHLLPAAAELVALANGWLAASPENLYAQGSTDDTQITLMLGYATGEMALLSVNRVETETALDIMLVGNRGVIYHETPIGRHALNAVAPELTGAGALVDVIAESLESGQPVAVEV